MSKTLHYKGTNGPFAHMFFFELADTDQRFMDHFISLCTRYLGGHPSQRHFSVGVRALEVNRNVSATAFEVSVHMIFESKKAYDEYSTDPKHEKFISESAGMSPNRIVYDSYLQDVIDQKPQAPAPKKAAKKKAAKK